MGEVLGDSGLRQEWQNHAVGGFKGRVDRSQEVAGSSPASFMTKGHHGFLAWARNRCALSSALPPPRSRAVPAIYRALDETDDPIARSRLLPGAVDVLLEAEDVERARAAIDELAGIAAQLDAPYLNALAAEAGGAVLLAEGDSRAALTKLRTAHRSWREPTRPIKRRGSAGWVGVACLEIGDGASAELEFEAAYSTLEELSARPDLERLARLSGSPRPGGQSPREAEVLALVAAGKTNRERGRAHHQREDGRATRQQHLHEVGALVPGRGHRIPLQARCRPVAPIQRSTQSRPRELGVSAEVGAPLVLYDRV
jgi:hypothetical protein